MEKETISGAEAMMRSLENQGVDVLFGYPGGMMHSMTIKKSCTIFWCATNKRLYTQLRVMPV